MSEIKTEEIDETLYNAFWSKLQQLKFDVIYYDVHFKRCVKNSRTIKYLVATVTSLATGAWMNWNNLPKVGVVCAVLIWILQAFSAFSEWLPFEKRKSELRELSTELDALYIEMEADWRKIQSSEMTNDKIRELLPNYAHKQANISKHYFKDDALPTSEKMRTKADELTEDYFKHFV